MIYALFLFLGAVLGLWSRVVGVALFSAFASATVIAATVISGADTLPAIFDAVLAVTALQAGYVLSILVRGAVANQVPRGFRSGI
ncbi:MAG TPA: hypothetical protein VFK86_00625 [Bauldia sp.]|nr:hypothetical protein [Bauldia sp.]